MFIPVTHRSLCFLNSSASNFQNFITLEGLHNKQLALVFKLFSNLAAVLLFHPFLIPAL